MMWLKHMPRTTLYLGMANRTWPFHFSVQISTKLFVCDAGEGLAAFLELLVKDREQTVHGHLLWDVRRPRFRIRRS